MLYSAGQPRAIVQDAHHVEPAPGVGSVARLRDMSRKRTPPRGIEELRDLSAKAANLFREKGVGPGDVVAGLLPRTVELMTVILGAWRLGAVYQPLLVKACGSPRLLSIRNLLYDQSDRYQRIAAQNQAVERDIAGEHLEICNATLARDAGLANCSRTHIGRPAEIAFGSVGFSQLDR